MNCGLIQIFAHSLYASHARRQLICAARTISMRRAIDIYLRRQSGLYIYERLTYAKIGRVRVCVSDGVWGSHALPFRQIFAKSPHKHVIGAPKNLFHHTTAVHHICAYDCVCVSRYRDFCRQSPRASHIYRHVSSGRRAPALRKTSTSMPCASI